MFVFLFMYMSCCVEIKTYELHRPHFLLDSFDKTVRTFTSVISTPLFYMGQIKSKPRWHNQIVEIPSQMFRNIHVTKFLVMYECSRTHVSKIGQFGPFVLSCIFFCLILLYIFSYWLQPIPSCKRNCFKGRT